MLAGERRGTAAAVGLVGLGVGRRVTAAAAVAGFEEVQMDSVVAAAAEGAQRGRRCVVVIREQKDSAAAVAEVTQIVTGRRD